MVKLIQPSFAKGELSPELHGRVDIAAYFVGLATARNMLVHTYGGISKRPGLRFLGPVKDHTYAPRLIPFTFKTQDNYILEFGHRYLRVIRNNAHITYPSKNVTDVLRSSETRLSVTLHGFVNGDEVYIDNIGGMLELNQNRFIVSDATANTFKIRHQVTGEYINSLTFSLYTSGGTVAKIFEIVSPYSRLDLDQLKYTQNADVITFAHNKYPVYELSRLAHDNWVFNQANFNTKVAFPNQLTGNANVVGKRTVKYTVSTIDKETGEESLAGVTSSKNITNITKANPAVITVTAHDYSNRDIVEIFNVGGMAIRGRFYVRNTTDDTFTIETLDGEPVDSTVLDDYTGGGSVRASFVKLTNSTGGTGGTVNISNIEFVDSTGDGDNDPDKVRITTDGAHGLTVNDEILITGVVGTTQLNNQKFLVFESSDSNRLHLKWLDGEKVNPSDFTAYISGGLITPTIQQGYDNTINWTTTLSNVYFKVYREFNGRYGLIGTTENTFFHDNNLEANLSERPFEARNPFVQLEDRPGSLGYYEQRRVFSGSLNKPDTLEFSRVGNHDNFTRSIPLQDDDAITATLNSEQINEIRHLVNLNNLLVFTSNSEWGVGSGPDTVFSGSSIRARPHSSWGSSHLKPIKIGNSAIFLQDNRKNIRNITYSFEFDAYGGNNLNTFSRHLLANNTVVDWCYTTSPDSIIYIVRDDGQALALSYDTEQEVLAWTRFDTAGFFERCISIQAQGVDNLDTVYWVVKRIINGNVVRYIETSRQESPDDIEDSFFVDSGLSYDNPLNITGANITSTNLTLTVTNHGLEVNDIVDIDGIVWSGTISKLGELSTENKLNGRRYKVRAVTPNTFSLKTMSGTAITGEDFSEKYLSGGVVRKAIKTVYGLDHLEGTTVTCLSDGNYIGNLIINKGKTTLPSFASRIHIGIPFTADLETLNLNSRQQIWQGTLKRVIKLTLRFYRSRGVFIGPSVNDLTEMKQREKEVYDDPISAVTGVKEAVLPASWNREGKVFLRSFQPLPLTVLAIIPDIDKADD